MNAPPPGYRPCAGIMLFARDGRVFVGRRIDTPDAWQLPQGGIDEGEEPRAAALRELAEEIGTANVRVLAEHPDWLVYDLPPELAGRAWSGRWRGQAQRWFACRLLGDDSEIDIAGVDHPEFDDWRWVTIDEVPALAIAFKRTIYTALAESFRRYATPER